MALPQGRESSEINTKPNLSNLMIDSSLIPDHTFESDMMEYVEIEYGDGENFKSTTVHYKLPILAEGEEVLWSYVQTEGIFNKKAVFVMALTSFRALIYDFQDPHNNSGQIFLSGVDDILVMNSHRESRSTRMGSFHSGGRMGTRLGTFNSMGSSHSQTVGDVVFMKDGEKFIVFGNMSDPSGIVRVAKSVKKTLTVRDKIPEIELPEEFKDSTVPKETILELSKLSIEDNPNQYIQRIKKEIEKNPDDVLFDLLFGRLAEMEDWEELEKVSREMIKKKNHENAFVSLCTSLFKINTDEAIKELNIALKLFPENEFLLDFKKQVAPYEDNLSKNKLIICPKCKKENELGSKFCNDCGKKMDDGCEKCGNVNPKNSKFCNDCGIAL
jgi:hypothetical protein